MKLGDLNHQHLGKRITIVGRDSTITGVLAGVSHEAQLIEDGPLFGGEPRYMLGRPYTHITIQGWGERKLIPEMDCEMEG